MVSQLGWSAKKNIPRILTKFGGVVGSLSETTQKKFELPRWRGRRAGGSQRAPSFEKNVFFCFFQLVKMACDLWNSTKKVQFEFLHLSEPPRILLGSKLRPLPRGQKVADRKNRVFIFQKNTIKGPSTSNTRPKNFFSSKKLI